MTAAVGQGESKSWHKAVKDELGGSPGSPMVRTLCSHCRWPGLNP